MCIQELGTIAQYNIPIRLMIMNNHWQGMVRQWQQSFYGERYSHSKMEEGRPNFVKLANSYNIKSFSITNQTQLNNLLLQTVTYLGAIIFDFLVIENENCYPMVSPGKSNTFMLGVSKN